MICLDTNYLIRSLMPGTMEASRMIAWTKAGLILATPAVVWYEFLCGPVSSLQVDTMRAFVRDIVSFGESYATESARIFNAVGRARRLRVDVMIAGTAIALGAPLATNNVADFSIFLEHGLELVK
jgi:predicted nucleic acid-binding protein